MYSDFNFKITKVTNALVVQIIQLPLWFDVDKEITHRKCKFNNVEFRCSYTYGTGKRFYIKFKSKLRCFDRKNRFSCQCFYFKNVKIRNIAFDELNDAISAWYDNKGVNNSI